MAKKVLGKGLGAIISNSPTPAAEVEEQIVEGGNNQVVELAITDVQPNPDQPRTHFDDEAIEGLADSIKAVGLIQPIIIRKKREKYYIVAGERRYRASKLLGFSTIKAIIIEASEEENLSLALIENVQRQDLDPIEEAKAYKLLVNRFKMKQSDVAKKVGKERATIANALRLLNLASEIQEALSAGTITVGHAKVLLSLHQTEQKKYFSQLIAKGLSVRALEKMIQDEKELVITQEAKNPRSKDAHIKKMEEKLVSALGTKVEIKHAGNKGKIEINYYSLDDFERIVEKFV
jgi:ParB family transcriptional regulator, chromosome partitioning protein